MKSTIAKKTEGYGYKYTELADINKYCEDNGITYFQEVETNEINQKDYIITYLTKGYVKTDDKGKPNIIEYETTKHRGCQIVEARLSGINNPVQAYGSSLTYCRRYSLLMALGLATEDDDGASLSEMTEEQAKEYVINFGKHKGSKLIDLINNEDPYVDWLLKSSNNQEVLKAIELLTGRVPLTDEEWDKKLELTQKLQEVIVEKELDMDKICKYYKVKNIGQLSEEQIKEIIEKRG